MYLKHLTIQKMKRIDQLKLDFTNPDGSPRMWTVLIGENGTAKSTILQAVAMAAAGRLRINDLAGEMIPSLMPKRRRDGTLGILARFEFAPEGWLKEFHPQYGDELPQGAELVSRVNLDAESTTLDGFDWYRRPGESIDASRESGPELTPLDWARSKNTANWFVAGYGVNRHFPYDTGSSPDLNRASVERLRPLFDHLAALTGTGFIDVFGARTQRGKDFVEILNGMLGESGLLPEDVKKVKLRGRQARKPSDLPRRNTFTQKLGGREVEIPLSGVAHGMQSTLAWVSDFVGQVLHEAELTIPAKEMTGCVLVDEIDLYLHPTWQVSLIHALRQTFPRVQFIATTHSPAMLAACKPDEIVRLRVDDTIGTVDRVAPHPDTGLWEPIREGGDPGLQQAIDPRMLSGSELYQHYFGLDGVTPRPEGEKVRRFKVLAGDPFRSDAEDSEVDELRGFLEDAGFALPPAAPRRQP